MASKKDGVRRIQAPTAAFRRNLSPALFQVNSTTSPRATCLISARPDGKNLKNNRLKWCMNWQFAKKSNRVLKVAMAPEMLTGFDCRVNKYGLKIRPFLDFYGNSSNMNILMSHGGGFDAMRRPAFASQGFRYTSPVEGMHTVRAYCMNLFFQRPDDSEAVLNPDTQS